MRPRNRLIPLEYDEQTRDLIELSRLCWLLDSCDFDEFPTIDVPFRLQARELCFGKHLVEWNGVRKVSSSSRSVSSPLSPVGAGEIYVTNNRLLFMMDVDSKTMRHTSVGKIEGYTDGVLLVRTSGGSVFLRFIDGSQLENQQLVLLLRRVCLEKPGALRASFPNTSFVSQFARRAEQMVVAEVVTEVFADSFEPRFTFRVVGTHYEGRQRFVNALTLDDPLHLAREPDNPVDANAVAVLDRSRNHLG